MSIIIGIAAWVVVCSLGCVALCAAVYASGEEGK